MFMIFIRSFYLSLVLLPLVSYAGTNSITAQDDTVYIPSVVNPPVINGYADDDCWTVVNWQSIDQVWIPYGESVSPSDFTGRYKVVWSEDKNLLYFVVEINDDVISDAYVPGVTAAIYNFDMIEVFIDENKSGNYHVFDGTANDEESLGINAENAFAYHIFTKFPESGQTTTTFRVEDLAGTSWANVEHPVYNDHFPEYVVSREGTVYTWEFSLIVYDDTYSDSNIEGSRVDLSVNKVMGLTLAFNDDDEPAVDPVSTERDNFFGSVAVSEEAYNDHWKNANDFGAAKLVGSPLKIKGSFLDESSIQIIPNPANDFFRMILNCDYTGNLDMKIFNTDGQQLASIGAFKDEVEFCQRFSFQFTSGIYVLKVSTGRESFTQKILIKN